MFEEKDKCITPVRLRDDNVCEFVCADYLYCKHDIRAYKKCLDECIEHW